MDKKKRKIKKQFCLLLAVLMMITSIPFAGTISVDAAQLKTPSITKLDNLDGSVFIVWGKVSGAVKYRVYRKKDGGKWTKIGDTAAPHFRDSNVQSGTYYTYTVRCINSAGTAFTSAYDKNGYCIQYVDVPMITRIENVRCRDRNAIELQWTTVDGAVFYNIYRREAGTKTWKKIYTTHRSGKSYSYRDAFVKDGIMYEYCVETVGSKGQSAMGVSSKIKSYFSLAVQKNCSVTNNAPGSLSVKWSQSKRADGYEVSYHYCGNVKTVTVPNSKQSTVITGLVKGRDYSVWVRYYTTVNGKKYYSGWSEWERVTVKK